MKTQLIKGDCIEEMKKMPENSVDAIITDPPYGLEFMGKNWDKFKEGHNIAGGDTGKDTPYARSKPTPAFYQLTNNEKYVMQDFFKRFGLEAIRVLKPGSFMLVMGGTRTYHRMVCGVEDAGFEIRDTIMWLYGSGFPKSLNVSRNIDKGLCEKEGKHFFSEPTEEQKKKFPIWHVCDYKKIDKGWGTSLKPACEPIVVARKPLSEKNIALNVLKWGTGGLNIDESRIEHREDLSKKGDEHKLDTQKQGWGFKSVDRDNQGRFPANIILDEEAGKMLDEQTGELKSGDNCIRQKEGFFVEHGGLGKKGDIQITYGDKGGASRFFYCAKTSRSERNFGLDDFEEKPRAEINKMMGNPEGFLTGSGNERTKVWKNNHPTVKPIKLMEYLIKLVTRPEAVVLDPFVGSGTTAIACLNLNRQFIGIEKEEEYIKIAEARIKPFLA